MVKCNVVSAHSREDTFKCFSVKDAFRQDCRSVGFGSEPSMSLRSKCQNGLCDACFHFDADSCSDGRHVVAEKELAFRLNGKCSSRRASGALNHRAGNVRGRHGVPW